LYFIKHSYSSLKKRRDYEIEGFTNDILMLRKQLKMLEKNILKYGPLEDKELVLLTLGIFLHFHIKRKFKFLQHEILEKRLKKFRQNYRI
jgi:hypothetical protein